MSQPVFRLRGPGSGPDQPRVLVVWEEDSVSTKLMAAFSLAGLCAQLATTMTAASEAARSGRFQVVISAPILRDGSWRRLSDIGSHYELGFVIILVATETEAEDWTEAIEGGVFEIFGCPATLAQGRSSRKTRRMARLPEGRFNPSRANPCPKGGVAASHMRGNQPSSWEFP